MSQYDQAAAIMTNTHLNELDSSDVYYLFSEGMEERYKHGNRNSENFDNSEVITDPFGSEMSGGDNSEENKTQKEKKTQKDKKDREVKTPIITSNATSTSNTDLDIDTYVQPTGGFPPIYIVMKKKEEEKGSKSRELATSKKSVSIRDILKKKKL